MDFEGLVVPKYRLTKPVISYLFTSTCDFNFSIHYNFVPKNSVRWLLLSVFTTYTSMPWCDYHHQCTTSHCHASAIIISPLPMPWDCPDLIALYSRETCHLTMIFTILWFYFRHRCVSLIMIKTTTLCNTAMCITCFILYLICRLMGSMQRQGLESQVNIGVFFATIMYFGFSSTG